MALQFVMSQRGQQLLIHEGHTFRREKHAMDKIFWKCTQYAVKKCPGRVHTLEGAVVKSTWHNHVPDAANVATKRIISAMKGRAIETQDSTSAIVGAEIAGVCSSVLGQLPSVPALRRSIQRARHKFTSMNCTDVEIPEEDVEIPEEYRETIHRKENDQLMFQNNHLLEVVLKEENPITPVSHTIPKTTSSTQKDQTESLERERRKKDRVGIIDLAVLTEDELMASLEAANVPTELARLVVSHIKGGSNK